MSKFKLGGIPSHARDHFHALRDMVCGDKGGDWSAALKALLAQKDPVQAKVLLSATYPLYLMRIGDEEKFLPLQQAGVVYDSGMIKVEIIGKVLEKDFKVRPITKEEENRISEIADAYSDSK